MRRAILLVVILLLPQLAVAGSSSVIIAAGYNPSVPSVRIQVPADYVAVPISIQNNSKDPLKRADEIEKALRSISDNIKKHSDLKVRSSVVSLSTREKSSLKAISNYDSYDGSYAQLYIFGALKPGTTVFSVAKMIYQAVNAILFEDGTKVILGNSKLGMDDPEKYRLQLLGLISKSTAEARKSLGATGPIEITGIENPVAVMQLNENEVILFIDYRLKIQTKTP